MRTEEDAGLDSFYNDYIKQYHPDITVRASFKLKRQYKSFLKDFFEGIQDHIIETGFIFQQKRLGSFCIKEFPTRYEDTGTRILKHVSKIDFKATKELGKLTFYRKNFDDRDFKVSWYKGRFKNRSYYNFRACRAFNRKLGQHIVKNNYNVNYIQDEPYRPRICKVK
jgi:hypothetical protein